MVEKKFCLIPFSMVICYCLVWNNHCININPNCGLWFICFQWSNIYWVGNTTDIYYCLFFYSHMHEPWCRSSLILVWVWCFDYKIFSIIPPNKHSIHFIQFDWSFVALLPTTSSNLCKILQKDCNALRQDKSKHSIHIWQPR